MIGLTGVYPAILMKFGNPETGVIASGYLGLILLATVFVAVGLLTSSLHRESNHCGSERLGGDLVALHHRLAGGNSW